MEILSRCGSGTRQQIQWVATGGRALLLAALLHSLLALEVTVQPAEVRAGDLVTWRIASVPARWLQDEVARTPRLRVQGPDGRTWERPCYLDQAWRPGGAGESEFVALGPVQLAARHSPRQPGPHAWQLSDPEGRELAAGTLHVQPGTRPPGPLRISPHQRRLLAWADGTPFLAIGCNLAWGTAPDRPASFARWCQRLSAQGATHVRLWLASWSGKPWDDAGRLRLDQAWLTDRYLELARQHGLTVTLVLDNFHDVVQGRGAPWGDSSAARARAFIEGPPPRWLELVRYCLARWGADDTIACWEPINEIDLVPAEPAAALAWLRRVCAWLAAQDPDQRLITASWAGPEWLAAMRLPEVQVAQVRCYVEEWSDADWRLIEATRDPLLLLAEAAAELAALDKPWLLAECGYQGREADNRGNELDREGLLVRQLSWAGLLLGGCGSGHSWWWDSYLERHDLWSLYGPLVRLAALLEWRDRELAPLTPNADGALRLYGWTSPSQALLWPVHRYDTWYEAVARGRPRPVPRAPVSVVLAGFAPRAAYRVAAYSLRDGRRGATWTQAARGDGTLELVIPPGTIDTVFHLLREGP